MDILTVLVLFLLKSFVMEGEAVTPVPGVALPESSSKTPPRASIVIAIFHDSVMLNGEEVATVSKSIGDRAPARKRRRRIRRQGLHPGRSRHQLCHSAARDVHVQRQRLRPHLARGDRKLVA
jgi:hypothetical protein